MTSIGLFGCGGIGVEVLHSLKHSAIRKLILVDFDTVELSNLSRQFIFTKADIGRFKVDACRIFALHTFENCETIALTAHLEDIELKYFENLDYIIAALDNADARRTLEFRAISAKATLIDAGTAGLSGSLRIFRYFSHHLSVSVPTASLCTRPQCYNCYSDSDESVLPVCTLRSKPETTNHCIAFALALGRGMMGEGELSDVKGKGFSYISETLYGGYFNSKVELKSAANHLSVSAALDIIEAFIPTVGFFDKFSAKDVEFVYAGAMLRAVEFEIPFGLSIAQVEETAGKIISAVCFANGLVGALVARAIERRRTEEYIFISKNAPYVRMDEHAECNPECAICGLDTYYIGIEQAMQFIEEYEHYYVYLDERCILQAEKEDVGEWFSEGNEKPFEFEIGEFLVLVSNKQKINICIEEGSECELAWRGRKQRIETIDLDESDEISVIQ